MSEAWPHPVWETLPGERQHGLVLALGQMAMRQIRSAPATAQRTIVETSDDDRRGLHAAAAWRPVREDLSPAS